MGSQSRGFNGSVNIWERCDFRSQFDPLSMIFNFFFLNTFLSAYTFWMKKYRIKSVSLKIVELLTRTRWILNKRHHMLLTLVSPGCSALMFWRSDRNFLFLQPFYISFVLSFSEGQKWKGVDNKKGANKK